MLCYGCDVWSGRRVECGKKKEEGEERRGKSGGRWRDGQTCCELLVEGYLRHSDVGVVVGEQQWLDMERKFPNSGRIASQS